MIRLNKIFQQLVYYYAKIFNQVVFFFYGTVPTNSVLFGGTAPPISYPLNSISSRKVFNELFMFADFLMFCLNVYCSKIVGSQHFCPVYYHLPLWDIKS